MTADPLLNDGLLEDVAVAAAVAFDDSYPAPLPPRARKRLLLAVAGTVRAAVLAYIDQIAPRHKSDAILHP